MLRKLLFISWILVIFNVSISWAEPHNVIFLIGDGMGFEHVKAAGIYDNGSEGTLFFESLPHQAEITTYSADSSVTDSAAAGTAIATATKVNNGVISTAIPGDGSELQTLLEYFSAQGKSTGLVSTAFMTHATPAAFGAHEPSRSNYNEIAQDYLTETRPNVLFGGGANGISVSAAAAAGYTVVTSRVGMQDLNTDIETMVSGQFGTDHLPYEYDYFTGTDNSYDVLPHLSEMTVTALDILDNDPDGFFLMVEGARIDHAGHINELERNIFETIEFDDTIQQVMDWAQGRSDTLVLVTADHETGGLTVTQNNGQGNFPDVTWSTVGHTGANVPVYAWGENAESVSGIMDNTDLFDVAILNGTIPSPTCEGYCGEQSVDGCWCDSQCTNYGDCCPDYEDKCVGPPPPKPGDSCGTDMVLDCNLNCNSTTLIGNGTCNESSEIDFNCTEFNSDGGDCVPAGPTCEGYCGGQSVDGCWCDSQCTNYGDCCPDYEDKCVGPPPPKPGDSCGTDMVLDCNINCNSTILIGNGTCNDSAETDFNCTEFGSDGGDCVPAGPTCEGYCGGESPDGCWCDSQCTNYGDCCPDKVQMCG